jgi:ubiquinone/menaquinone biosynthesis C-methylase UbiE
MDHADHVALIREGIVPGVWADLGSGRGAFTLALADLLGPGARIYSVDRDARALHQQRQAMEARFPTAQVTYLQADFSSALELPVLDGVLMANSLHFVRDQRSVLARIRDLLRVGGRLLLVEYDSDRGNPWVPYPLSYAAWARLASAAGLADTRLLARRPSRFMGALYAAASVRPSGLPVGPS